MLNFLSSSCKFLVFNLVADKCEKVSSEGMRLKDQHKMSFEWEIFAAEASTHCIGQVFKKFLKH